MVTSKTSVMWPARPTLTEPRETKAFPGLDSDTVIELLPRGDEGRTPVRAALVSVVDTGVVLRCESEADGQSFANGTKVRLITHTNQSAYEALGVVVGGLSAGLAVRIEKSWTKLERRAFPRAQASVYLRYSVLDEQGAKRASAAIRSRLSERRLSSRRSEMPHDRTDVSALLARIQTIEQTLAWMTDLLLCGQAGNAPLKEREVNLSAGGVAFEVDRLGELEAGSLLELVMLLPMSDPAQVRCTGSVVRVITDAEGRETAAVKYECLSDVDRDAIARYVFQLQRRRTTFY